MQALNVNLWTQEEILTSGINFLHNEVHQINSYLTLWKSAAANWEDAYNDQAFEAAKKYKASVLLSKNKTKILDHSISKAIEAADPITRTKLTKIASVTKHALNYFTALEENSRYPSMFGKGLQWLSTASLKLLFAGVAFTGVANLNHRMFNDSHTSQPKNVFIDSYYTSYSYPKDFFTPLKAVIIASIGINTLYLLYHANNGWNHSKVKHLKALFEANISNIRK